MGGYVFCGLGIALTGGGIAFVYFGRGLRFIVALLFFMASIPNIKIYPLQIYCTIGT